MFKLGKPLRLRGSMHVTPLGVQAQQRLRRCVSRHLLNPRSSVNRGLADLQQSCYAVRWVLHAPA